MTILEAIKKAAAALEQAAVPDSRLDAEYLLAHVLSVGRMSMLLNGQTELSSDHQRAFDALITRRTAREPLQYIIGLQSFMGLSFHVDKHVLIPRPETEILCEQAIHWLQQKKLSAPRVLDLCTGSGALAVAIAHTLPDAQVFATDISASALAMAQRNAKANNVLVKFAQGDFLEPLKGLTFDCIVCNPPYIPTGVCKTLQPEVMMEPENALDGGNDGLVFYKRLALESHAFLTPGGALFCEVGFDQAATVEQIFTPVFELTTMIDDLCHIPRIVTAVSSKRLPGGNDVRQV